MRIFKRITTILIILSMLIITCSCYTEVAAPIQKDEYKAEGQVRNNKIVIDERTFIQLFWDDPVFENFQETNKKYDEYESGLIDEAKSLGIDSKKLKKCLDSAITFEANGSKATKIIYPVIIETAEFDGKDCFVLVFAWEIVGVSESNRETVGPMGHIYIAVVNAKNGKVIASERCK